MLTNVFDHPNVTGLCPSAIFPLRYSIPSVALWQRTGDWWMVWIFWCGFLRAESDLLVMCLEFDASGSLCIYCIFLLTNLTELVESWNTRELKLLSGQLPKFLRKHGAKHVSIPVPGWKLKQPRILPGTCQSHHWPSALRRGFGGCQPPKRPKMIWDCRTSEIGWQNWMCVCVCLGWFTQNWAKIRESKTVSSTSCVILILLGVKTSSSRIPYCVRGVVFWPRGVICF